MSFISPDDYSSFDPDRIIIETAVPIQGEQGQKFQRMQIRYRYPNDLMGPLVVQTPALQTYGVSTGSTLFKKPNTAPQLSLVMYKPEVGPTTEEKQFMGICDKILNKVKTHLCKDHIKEELGKWEMDNDVRSLKLFYIKTEKGKPIKGYPPTLYSKLYYREQDGEIVVTTRIADANTGAPIPPQPALGPGKVYATVIFATVYIGHKPSIQTRIGEIMVMERTERAHFLKPLPQKPEPDESHSTPVLKLKAFARTSK